MFIKASICSTKDSEEPRVLANVADSTFVAPLSNKTTRLKLLPENKYTTNDVKTGDLVHSLDAVMTGANVT